MSCVVGGASTRCCAPATRPAAGPLQRKRAASILGKRQTDAAILLLTLENKGSLWAGTPPSNHPKAVKAAWKGHDDALRWLLLDPDGPKLTAQLHIPDLEGLSVAQLARMGGNERTAVWLEQMMDL